MIVRSLSALTEATHVADLPLRLTIVGAGKRCFRYLILGNDGTVVEASSTLFPTAAAARMAAGPILRRRSLAAKPTP
jgi:hypothetical protein